MFTKEEASKIRSEFWTTLGQYLKPIPSEEGEKINWINYKTGIKEIQYKMNAEKNYAFAGVDIVGTEDRRNQLFKVFETLRDELSPELLWVQNVENDAGNVVDRIYADLEDSSIYKKEDWSELISFFKQNIIAFDKFWVENKFIFETL